MHWRNMVTRLWNHLNVMEMAVITDKVVTRMRHIVITSY